MNIRVLEAERRKQVGSSSARRLRAQGRVPGVLYGHGEEVVPLSLDGEALEELLHTEMQAVDLQVDGKADRALIKEVQYDTWGDACQHIDFARVSMDETVTVTVNVETHGTPGEVEGGAVLEHPLMSLEVECRVDSIPNHLTVEVSEMTIGDTIEAGAVPLPDGVSLVTDPQAVVAVLRPPMEIEEEEEEAELEAEGAEPELISRGKEEEGEEAQAEEG